MTKADQQESTVCAVDRLCYALLPFISCSIILRTVSVGITEVRERVSKNTFTHSAVARQVPSLNTPYPERNEELPM